MTHTFTSSELARLLQEQLATGTYASEEDVLIAGLQALRERDERIQAFQARRRQLQAGNGFVIEGDDALGAFFDEIDAEVDQDTGGRT